ncbi:MAG: hypothetical protein PHD29_04265 [bacterium]|nr:hypothetical protein [bacterium]MDD5354031.1 hypothetical protein [bacterium]MDD5755978.1 hypothetical protein [bacterium]
MQQGKALYTRFGIIIILVIALIAGFNAWRKYQTKQAQIVFTKAEALYNNKKYQEAVQEYESVGAKYSYSEYAPPSLYKAGYIYCHFLFNDAAAAKALQKLVARPKATPYRKEGLILFIDIYDRLRQYKERNDVITRLMKEYPGAVDEDVLRLELAKSLNKMGQAKEALAQLALIKNKESDVIRSSQEYYHLLIIRDPADPQPHLELARIYKQIGLQKRAAGELETATWLKKNAAALKAAQQKTAAPPKSRRGNIEKEVPPKIELTPREKKLYIDYTVAQNKTWRAAMNEESQSLGAPADEQQAMVFGAKLQQYEKEWWSDWYTKNQTSYEECEKIRLKVMNDQGLARQLNEGIAKITD